ncbi:MAG: hypothetical protein V3W32_01540, partial [Gemmatimonadota bacterium]
MTRTAAAWLAGLVVLAACGGQANSDMAEAQTEAVSQADAPFRTDGEGADHLILEDERHFGSLIQLTFG